MFLGPFWCDKQKLWVRFNIQADNSCLAEIATADTRWAKWMPVNKGSWVTNAKLEFKPSPQEIEVYPLAEANHGFYLDNGVLYKTNWHQSHTSGQFEVSQLIANGDAVRVPPEILKGENNPFKDVAPKPIPLDLLPELPLTPEMQQTRLKKWQKMMRRNSLVSQVSLTSRFSKLDEKLKNKEEIFYSYCGSRLFEVLDPELFSDPYSYLATLETIKDETSDLYQSLKYIASQTAFDRETKINPNNENSKLREQLYISKLNYLLDLVAAERADLLDTLHLPITPLIYPRPISFKASELPLHRNNEDKMDSYSNDPIEPISSGSLDDPNYYDRPSVKKIPANSLTRYTLPIVDEDPPYQQKEAIETLNDEAQLQEAINLSLKDDSKEELDEAIVDESILTAIKDAVVRAVVTYQDNRDMYSSSFFGNWSQNEMDQQTVLALNDELQAMTNNADAIELISNFLNDSDSEHRPHPFSKFLLNELKHIPNENLPWFDLKELNTRNNFGF
ncbi:hypothetical protein [Legionella gresilensis]|uniref:hypothetical protein n=1 Tax=Legionella gresilensis TaxID=91823 RepID=UPI001041A5EC|nr:hypothetical protein [Legionella gresilensis]